MAADRVEIPITYGDLVGAFRDHETESEEVLAKLRPFLKPSHQWTDQDSTDLRKEYCRWKYKFDEKWQGCSRTLNHFMKKNAAWLELKLRLPITLTSSDAENDAAAESEHQQTLNRNCILCGGPPDSNYHKPAPTPSVDRHRPTPFAQHWTNWKSDSARSLRSLLNLSEKFSQAELERGPYCTQCSKWVWDIHFTLTQLKVLEQRLDSLKENVENAIHFGPPPVREEERPTKKRKTAKRIKVEGMDGDEDETFTVQVKQENLENDPEDPDYPDWSMEQDDPLFQPEAVSPKPETNRAKATRVGRPRKFFGTCGTKRKHKKKPHNPTDRTKPPICKVCFKKFRYFTLLERHMRKEHPPEHKYYKCRTCSKIFRFRRDLVNHVKEDHPELYTCKICSIILPTVNDMPGHMWEVHPPEKKLSCSVCSKTFRFKISLHQHQLKEHPCARIKCTLCGVSCKTEQTLDRHMKTNHQDGIGLPPFQCPTCSLGFQTQVQLDQHQTVHNSANPFTCSTCYRIFTNSVDLGRHVKSHLHQFHCKVEGCGKSFASEAALNKHIKLHSASLVKVCEVCGYSCGSNAALKVHMNSHSEERNFRCELCPAAYKMKKGLTRHMMTHTGERPHKCRICEKRFIDTTHLRCHEETHSGTKHICDTCGKEFTQKCNLWHHVRSVHQGMKRAPKKSVNHVN